MEKHNLKLIQSIQNATKALRRQAEMNQDSFSVDEPVFTEIRQSIHNEQLIEKLIIFLRGTGCSSIHSNGGCTFCGFYSATNLGIPLLEENFINQFESGISSNQERIDEFPVISLYNDGSMLAENEIQFSVVIELIARLSKYSNLKRITLESRLSDIREEKIQKLRSSTIKELEIAFGFESSDSTIRKYCVNKNFSNFKLVETLKLLKSNGIYPVALLMIKPPFLTEMEAIQDCVKSLQFLEDTDIHRIDLELPTVEKFTLTHELWKKGYYKPIYFWTLLEILRIRKELNLKKRVYISPPNYTVESIDKSSNCEICNPKMEKLFIEYNVSNDYSVFNNLTCKCEKDWRLRLEPKNLEKLPLLKRIESLMEELKT